MATGIVIGGILLAADQELGVEEFAVGAGADLVDGGGVEIDEDGARDVFAIAGLSEEGLVRAGVTEVLRIGVRTAISGETVLKQVPVAGLSVVAGQNRG